MSTNAVFAIIYGNSGMNSALDLFSSKFSPPAPKSAGALCISSLTGSADAFAALSLALSGKDRGNGGKIVLAITSGIPDADRLAGDLRILTGSKEQSAYPVRILEFPPRLDDDKSSLGIRLKTVAALKAFSISPYPCVIVSSYQALLTPVADTASEQMTLYAKTSSNNTLLKFDEIGERLAKTGYSRVPAVEQQGDYSIRGGILDVWSPGEEFPFRAEFFGDELESLRTFDAATQISIERIESATILPINEIPAGTDPASAVGTDPEKMWTNPERSGGSLLDLLPSDADILAIEHNNYPFDAINGIKSGHRIIFTGEPAPRGVPTFAFQTSPLPGFAELGAEEAHHPELFDSARIRLERHLAAAEKRAIKVARIDDLSGGFEIDGLIVVTKADRVFAKRKTPVRTNAAIVRGPRLNDFDDLEPGEYVVHLDYGVGRYIGSCEITVGGRRGEVFTIEYADGGKLHVPAAHAHLLSRYIGVKGEDVKLHRLDGKRWAKDKEDAQKAVSDLAAALLETQARRETVPGFAYDVPCDGLEAFEAAFPYEETPDQIAAIAAVKGDLAKAKPMDRLICGDAGYGKTEVAMRAAFIAAMNGRQVAVLAPTTVLAEQHFETFTSRFDGTPIRIESVSRFQGVAVHNGTFARLADGVCDIVIGTHAILSGKIRFRDLGLIIIDEEQRFGVRHKEFLKRLRATADVLTLSATPIPRTLYLSMTGARDLSLLRTPPRERVAVETLVVRDGDETVRSAVENELRRGGQVYFLHNRVSSMPKMERRLKALCPEARIVVAHGRMDSRTLARKMREFERGDHDVLLSTTIIESGIDIPRANTILVDRADTFGMADLYQLRGRVGRSAKRGRAYFLLPESGDIDSDARERLSALKRHGGLGGGFNLAVRDLELRGAGNLLGSQQSGHIAAVGFSLYCQLLKRTIAILKGEKTPEIVDVKLNLDFIELSPADPDGECTAALPYGYVEEDSQRMNFMKRFAEACDRQAVKALASELKDRFGALPPAAGRLVKLAELRVECASAGISHIDVKDERAIFYRNGSRDMVSVSTLKAKNADRKISELTKAVRALRQANA